MRADLLEVFIIINVLDFSCRLFIMENYHGKTSGHSYKINKLHSFTQTIVNDWNRLPRSALMSASVYQFKGHIDKYLRNRAEDYASQRLTPFLVPQQLLDYTVKEGSR